MPRTSESERVASDDSGDFDSIVSRDTVDRNEDHRSPLDPTGRSRQSSRTRRSAINEARNPPQEARRAAEAKSDTKSSRAPSQATSVREDGRAVRSGASSPEVETKNRLNVAALRSQANRAVPPTAQQLHYDDASSRRSSAKNNASQQQRQGPQQQQRKNRAPTVDNDSEGEKEGQEKAMDSAHRTDITIPASEATTITRRRRARGAGVDSASHQGSEYEQRQAGSTRRGSELARQSLGNSIQTDNDEKHFGDAFGDHPASMVSNEGGHEDAIDLTSEGCNGRLYDLLQADPEVPASEIKRIFNQTSLRSQYKEAFRILGDPEKKRVYDIVGEPCVESLNKGWGDVVALTGSTFSAIFYGLAMLATAILFLLFFIFLPMHIDRRSRSFTWHGVLSPLYALSCLAVFGALILCIISVCIGGKRDLTIESSEKAVKGGGRRGAAPLPEPPKETVNDDKTRNRTSKLSFRHPLGRLVAAAGYTAFVFLVGSALYTGDYPDKWMNYFIILIVADCLTILEWMSWLYPKRMRKIFESYKADNPDVTIANSVVGGASHKEAKHSAAPEGRSAPNEGLHYQFLVYGFMLIGVMDFALSIVRCLFIGMKIDGDITFSWYIVVVPLALRFVTAVFFRLHTSRIMHRMDQRTAYQVVLATGGSLILNSLPFVTTYMIAGYLEGDGGYDLVYAFIPMYFLVAYFFFASLFTMAYMYRKNRDFIALEAHEAEQMRIRKLGAYFDGRHDDAERRSNPFGDQDEGDDDDENYEEVSIYDDKGKRYVRKRLRKGLGGEDSDDDGDSASVRIGQYADRDGQHRLAANGGRKRVRYGEGGEVFMEGGFGDDYYDDDDESSEGDEMCISEATREEFDEEEDHMPFGRGFSEGRHTGLSPRNDPTAHS